MVSNLSFELVAVSLQDDIQRTFVKEVERVARDPVYWVRREASFAVGALAKVVPEEVINISLVGF
jgi:serine/threonine-protein phosphatase 4 regulatory subunit 1